jgi:CRP/FNR family transcriptional regulator, anaerobic regulatory protein
MAAAVQRISNEDAPSRCRDCISRREGFCAGLTGAELAKIHPYMVRKRLPAGEQILTQGVSNSSYVHVLDGTVKLTATLNDGAEQIVGLRFSGDFIGQRFAREVNYTAETATSVEYCRVSKTALDQLADSNTDVAHLMHRLVSTELEETRQLMVALSQRDARQRVAGLVYRIGQRQSGSTQTARIELPLSRAEIANYLGLTVETVSRQLSGLKRDRLISIERKTLITINSMGQLAIAAGITA